MAPGIFVVIYGQQRFHWQDLGLLRTTRELSQRFSEVQISGHLWSEEQPPVDEMGVPFESKALMHQVEISNADLIEHYAPPGQDTNLVWQATSQRRAIQVALQATKQDSDLVILTRTDLFIPCVKSLMHAFPKFGEVWTSNFHHEGVDDNIAILSWSTFQKLTAVDFRRALEDPSVLHGEHLREQLFSQSKLRLTRAFIPYVILKRGISPYFDLTLASLRFALRHSLPGGAYRFATSPKSELVRLTSQAIQKMRSARFEE